MVLLGSVDLSSPNSQVENGGSQEDPSLSLGPPEPRESLTADIPLVLSAGSTPRGDDSDRDPRNSFAFFPPRAYSGSSSVALPETSRSGQAPPPPAAAVSLPALPSHHHDRQASTVAELPELEDGISMESLPSTVGAAPGGVWAAVEDICAQMDPQAVQGASAELRSRMDELRTLLERHKAQSVQARNGKRHTRAIRCSSLPLLRPCAFPTGKTHRRTL